MQLNDFLFNLNSKAIVDYCLKIHPFNLEKRHAVAITNNGDKSVLELLISNDNFVRLSCYFACMKYFEYVDDVILLGTHNTNISPVFHSYKSNHEYVFKAIDENFNHSTVSKMYLNISVPINKEIKEIKQEIKELKQELGDLKFMVKDKFNFLAEQMDELRDAIKSLK